MKERCNEKRRKLIKKDKENNKQSFRRKRIKELMNKISGMRQE